MKGLSEYTACERMISRSSGGRSISSDPVVGDEQEAVGLGGLICLSDRLGLPIP